MNYRALVFVFLSFFCLAVAVPSVPETRFPVGSCIVESEFSAPNCEELYDHQPTHDLALIINKEYYFYPSFEQAINKCPFNPMVIYMVGTNYFPNRTLVYDQTKDLRIVGYQDEATNEKSILVGLGRVTVVNTNVKVLFENVTFYQCPGGPDSDDFLSSLESE